MKFTTTTQEALTVTTLKLQSSRALLPAATRTRAFTNSISAGRSVHTESLPNVRRFTNSPYESLVTGNRRVF